MSSTTSVCGPPSHHTVPLGPTVTTEVCLRRQVVPSARMEAPMQYYYAAGFSKEVSRLAAAPRRPCTNRMYDDRSCSLGHRTRIDPLPPTAAQIDPFLYYLFDTHGLSPQTIKG